MIERYERSEIKPSIEVAVKITEAFNVSLDDLAGSTDLILGKGIENRIQKAFRSLAKKIRGICLP